MRFIIAEVWGWTHWGIARNLIKARPWRASKAMFNTRLVPRGITEFCCGCSVTQSCLTLCDPMDCSTPGFPVLHNLLEFAQTHMHWVGDAIQPSHPPLPPSLPALNLSQHQGLLQWTKVLQLQLQHQSFQWIFITYFFRIDWFDFLAVQGTPKSLLQHNSLKTLILWHSTFLWFNSHIDTWLLGKP